MDFNTRFLQIIDNQCGGNKKKFSELTNIPYTTVIDYANSLVNDPKISLIIKIMDAIPSISLHWLVRGEGQMKTELSDQKLNNEPSQILASKDEQIASLKEVIKAKDELIKALKSK
ncbi:MAG: hypothetical protein ABJO02_11195 [Reichenbachiella sp.]|uniref:hypothetical protein n=1 Tax=Reichenbachiella sp. TaxID=2184521 RepID=UPI003298E110